MLAARPRSDEARRRELAQREAPLRVLVSCNTTRFRDAEQQRAFWDVFRRIEAADAVALSACDVADETPLGFDPARQCVLARARRERVRADSEKERFATHATAGSLASRALRRPSEWLQALLLIDCDK